MVALRINDQSYEVDVSPDIPLLCVLRDVLRRNGTSQAAISLENARLYVELDTKLRFWKLQSEVSASFAATAAGELDVPIRAALGRVGEFFDLDRITIDALPDSADAGPTHAWTGTGVAPARDDMRSAIGFPLVIGGVTIASMTLIRVTRAITWSDEVLQQAQLLAEVFANALGRQRAVRELERSTAELARVQRELHHASRAMSLGVLAASIAHELNQPLSGILTNASTCVRMLGAEPANLEGALETARRTIRDGHRASEIVARLRTLFGKKEFAAAPVDLNEATREVVALISHELQRHRIALRVQLDDGLPKVLGDQVQLQQVILNLLLNASDATRSVDGLPRQIVIETACYAGAVRLAVRDTGVGIQPDALGKLFDAFFTTKAEGMGIGLSVSRSIVERHGGKLWATTNEGPGATFTFSIPCANADGVGSAATAPATRPLW